MQLTDGATVYDALEASGVALVTKGGLMGTYVSSIAGLGEKEAGSLSGWSYLVNGLVGTVSADEHKLKDGDSIEWLYVLEPKDTARTAHGHFAIITDNSLISSTYR